MIRALYTLINEAIATKRAEAVAWAAFKSAHEKVQEAQCVLADLHRSTIELNAAAVETERARKSWHSPVPEASAELSAARKVAEAARDVMLDTSAAKAFDVLGLALESYYDARGKE